MRTFLKIFFIIVLSSGQLKSQLNPEWVRNYNGPVNGNDESLALAIDADGNVYSSGKFLSVLTGFDIYTVKYNSSGNIIWEQTFNGPGNGNDIAYSVALDNSGNVYVAGESKGENTNVDYVLIKYNSLGQEQWHRRYNGVYNSVDIPVSVKVDNNDNPVITGESWEEGVLFDLVTIKYNSEGVLQWRKQFNGTDSGNELADDLEVDASGNVYVSGSSFAATTINDFLLIKYSSNGDELWTRSYNGPANGNDNMTSLALDNSGNVIITGSSVGSGSSLDFATLKYSPAGNELWLKRFTTPTVNVEEPKEITTDLAGNIYITGTTTGFESSYDFMTVKYSPAGDEVWSRNYNGPASFNFDEPSSIAADNTGNVFVTGLSAGTGTMDDIVIVKYNTTGDEVWDNRFNTSANRDERPSNIFIDNNGSLIVSGFITGSASGRDFSVIKFSQLTSVNTLTAGVVSEYQLFQNYPNPFNPVTKINYELRVTNYVSLKVYDALGNEVASLVDEKQNPSSYEIVFNGENFPSGIYFYKLDVSSDKFAANEFSEVRKMILIK